MWDELGAIIVDFLGGDDEDPFAHIESTVRRLRAWFCTYFFEIDDLDLLGIWTLFEDGSEEAEFAGEVGGEATPGFLQSAVFLVWLKSMILELSAMIEAGAGAGAGDDMGSKTGRFPSSISSAVRAATPSRRLRSSMPTSGMLWWNFSKRWRGI